MRDDQSWITITVSMAPGKYVNDEVYGMEGASVGHWHSMDGSPLWLGGQDTKKPRPIKGRIGSKVHNRPWMTLSEEGSRKRIRKREERNTYTS